MIGMGNKFSQDSPTQVRPPFTVKASEPDTHNEGLFSSLKSALGGSSNPPALKPTEPTEITSSGDSLSQTPSKPNESPIAEDPRTITSSLPSFPGTWNELHKVKELLPQPFDGIRAVFNKGLSHHFQVSHNFTLAAMQPSSYKFGATYAGTKQLSQSETFPILTGEMDPSGNLTAQCLHAFTSNTRSRLIAQHQNGELAALELGTDYRGSKCTLSLTAANPDLLAQTGIYIGHCLFAVKPNLAVGAEALFQRVLHPALGQVVSQLSGGLVAKYNGEDWSATAQISPLEMSLHTSYYHKMNEHQAVGVELEGRGAAGECSATLAYSFEIPNAECTVKASIDSNLSIATTIDKKLTPLPMSLTLCCQGNPKESPVHCWNWSLHWLT
ncbi:TOMM40L [Bugula neritina]|uniref:TOMM40L n=1 Tax=Bugula neritina TaxID=10212 RepID=A0A7J7JZJ8_BUGNE|nr:TOMM40L [Bugula neritina]